MVSAGDGTESPISRSNLDFQTASHGLIGCPGTLPALDVCRWHPGIRAIAAAAWAAFFGMDSSQAGCSCLGGALEVHCQG